MKIRQEYELPSINRLKQCLSCDFETGTLTWKPQPDRTKQWNARYSGKPALTASLRGGYRHGQVDRVKLRAHRVVWALYHGRWPSQEIDHINGNPSDNRIENLREVSRSAQMQNCRKGKANKSGQMGVFWHKRANRWTAQISVGGKSRHLGLFDDLEDAVTARKKAELENGFHQNHGR